MESRITAILLAAGLSNRMGKDKLLLPYKGKTLLQHAVDLLIRLPVHERILVTTKSRVDSAETSDEILTVKNHKPEAGQSESLKLGLSKANGDYYMFLMADQPLLTPECLAPMFDMIKSKKGMIIYPAINGKPCSPALFHSRFRDDLMGLSGDAGGRAIRNLYPDACVAYEPSNLELFIDIDNEEDFMILTGESI